VSLIRNKDRQTIALTYMATFEPSTGWSLLSHRVIKTVEGTVSDRLRYSGLTAGELIDVIEASAQRELSDI
jgi:hypothetical protein